MNICQLLHSPSGAIKAEVADLEMAGLSRSEAIDSLVTSVIEQTKQEVEQGVCHGFVENCNSNGK